MFNFQILNPKGFIALAQRDLIVTAVLLMLIAVVPILIMTFWFAWRYRASGHAKYTPKVDGHSALQFSWLLSLALIITALGVIGYQGAHALDPRKPIVSNVEPITIQVVALQWKWLFIYPEQNVASINLLQLPVNTPVKFEITADAPMNSFWIPQLGGQMYAMNGMKTTLHLMATETGDYRGFSSNISGEGFAGMRFIARASSEEDFQTWVESAKSSGQHLDFEHYQHLAMPTENNQEAYFRPSPGLFDEIIKKFTVTGEMEH